MKASINIEFGEPVTTVWHIPGGMSLYAEFPTKEAIVSYIQEKTVTNKRVDFVLLGLTVDQKNEMIKAYRICNNYVGSIEEAKKAVNDIIATGIYNKVTFWLPQG